jgi:hypothetical protein
MKKLVLSALVCAYAQFSFAASPADVMRNLRAPTLAAPAAVNNVVVNIGHLKLTLASGSAAKVNAGSDTIGVYFKGSGSFEYVAEATEMPVVTRNVKSDAHVKLAGNTISDEITEVLLLGTADVLPAVGESGGASLADAFKAHQAVFDRARVAPPWHLLAVYKMGLPGKAAHAQIITARDNLAYKYDSTDAQEESLTSLHPYNEYLSDKSLQQQLFPTVLSSQPVGRDVKTYAKPVFTVTALDYNLVADGDNAKLEVTETIVPRVPGQQALRFGLENQLLVKVNTAPRQLRLMSATDEQGRPQSFSHDDDNLLLVTAAPVTQAVKVKFSIEGDFLIREGGDNAWQLFDIDWFPRPLAFAANNYTVHSVVKVKKPFVPIAPGDTISRKEEGDYTITENVIDKPIQFANVQGGKYNIVEEKRGDLTIRVATYGMRNDRAAKQLTELAYGIINYYQVFLGPFPWKEFNIVQVNSYGYGRAPAATMFITNEAFNPTLGDEDEQYYSQGINERFAHEIAHQYWGSVVKMPSREEQWLTESFAEYSAALFLKKYQSEAIFNRMTNTWRARAKESAAIAPIPYANRIGGDSGLAFAARTHLLYNKGPILLSAIHKQLGDEKMLIFLKSYQKSFLGKFGTTKDVAGLLSFMTKQDWNPFFDQYYWGLAMPQ